MRKRASFFREKMKKPPFRRKPIFWCRKKYKNWPKEQQSQVTVLWDKDTALLLLKKEDSH